MLNLLGAPGVVLVATTLAALAAVLFSPPVPPTKRLGCWTATLVLVPLAGQLSRLGTFNVIDTKGHEGAIGSFSANGIRSPGSACTTARTATGR